MKSVFSMASWRRFVSQRTVLLLAALGCMLYLFLPAAPVFAVDVIGGGCEGVTGSSLCDDNKTQTPDSNDLYGPDGLLTKITDILGTVIGVVSVIVITVGGIRYGLSSGDPNNIKGAKDTILFAIVGLVVALLAKAVVIFVLSRIE